MDIITTQEQNVILYNRKRIELTGITDVTAFSDTEVQIEYPGGSIAIEGEQLKIDGFSSDTGILYINGTVNGFFYFGNSFRSKRNKRGR